MYLLFLISSGQLALSSGHKFFISFICNSPINKLNRQNYTASCCPLQIMFCVISAPERAMTYVTLLTGPITSGHRQFVGQPRRPIGAHRPMSSPQQ